MENTMKQQLTTLGKVFDRVDALSAACYDLNINVPEISFDNLDLLRIAGKPHKIRPVAQRSISNRLGIPYPYLRRCPPDVQAQNLNHWITQEKNDQLLFRFDAQDVRAVFTTKYIPVDNFEVCERLDSLGYGLDTEVQCYVDPEFMSLSIPDGAKAFDINGDKFKPGISISNSEVGLASLSIAAFVLRLVCTNGLVAKSDVSASYRHVSIKILSEFPQVLDKVSYELSAQRSQFKLSMESPVDDPESTLASFNRQFGLNAQEKEAVEWAWPQEMGTTMFNVVNTYTRAAQRDELSAESSFRLSRVGGNILGMLN
jgi:Domain of unknown function (DUF932)